MVNKHVVKEEARVKALQLLSSGVPAVEVSRQTGLDFQYVRRQLGWLKSPMGQLWLNSQAQKLGVPLSMAPVTNITPPEPEPKNIVQQGEQVKNPGIEKIMKDTNLIGATNIAQERADLSKKENDGQAPQIEYLSDEGMMQMLEKNLYVAATPIIRKIVLNPLIYFWYDYSKTNLGFKGDIGDFIHDCVEDFFDSRGIHLVVEQRRVQPVA